MSYRDQEMQLQQDAMQDMLGAFEKWYHDDIVMVEATGDVREGKDVNREFEKGFVATLKEVHGGGLGAVTSDEENGITMSESWMEATFQDGNRVKMEEVSVKKWDGDKVIHERFYYNAAGMG